MSGSFRPPRRLQADEITAARDRLAPHLPPTPLRRAHCVAGGQAWLKLECWQPTGSFKVRGALNLLLSLDDDARRRGVVAASAGNHALGVAYAASRLGGAIPVTVFVPESAPRAKVDKLRTFPVTVREVGRTYDDAAAAATAHAEQTGAVPAHAYEDPFTAAGQGTVALEILEQLPDVATVLVPVGGGGLIAGIATVLKARAPHVRVVAVQPEASPAWRESLRLGRPLLEYHAAPTLADGLAGGIGEIPWLHRDLIDDAVTVDEPALEDAIRALLGADQVLAEGAGAVGVAALRSGRIRAAEPAVVVVTGANLDLRVLARLLRAT